jgi:CHAD domain-containing protein
MDAQKKTSLRAVPTPAALPPDEAPAPGGVGDTLAHRLGRAIERLEDPALPPAWVIHEVRKDLKRVRALLRLSGDVLPTRRLEKQCGAAARELSHLRDADAAGETAARLRLRADASELEAVDSLRDWLRERRHSLAGTPGLPRPVAEEAAGQLREVLRQVETMPFNDLAPAALDDGLTEAWNDTAEAFRRVLEQPVLPRFHDLRKAVKRELHQRELSGRPLDRMDRATLKKMAEVLGELQDLDVLREILRESGRWRGRVRRLVKRTIRELKARALRLGAGRYPEQAS